jgi:hypothetical protein
VATPDGGISIRRVLPPGESFRYGRELRWDGSGELKISLGTDRVNRRSEDYREGKARFTAFVTVAFGQESERLGWRRRVSDFFFHIVDAFPPSGIRLTYAIGNSVPVGSMYRLHEEETVFVVAGEDQAGKEVTVERDVRADFRAAYGREARGGVDRIVAGGGRLAGEDGAASVKVAVTLPKAGGEGTGAP